MSGGQVRPEPGAPGAGEAAPEAELAIAIPVYNDWESAAVLLGRIDRVLAGAGLRGTVLFIDDGSTEEPFSGEALPPLAAVGRVALLSLTRNLGHQRALAIGLSYINAHLPCRRLVVMDADGEDDPADIPRLLERLEREGDGKVIFAGRARRSENLAFRAFYQLYKGAHLLLTGIPVRFGNFSAVPWRLLPRLASVPDLWNHYAAAVLKSRIPYGEVPTARSTRISGDSRMSFISLVVHGLSAVSVFGERVGVRLLVALCALTVLFGATLAAIAGLGLFAGLVVPGWAWTAAGFLTILLVQMLMLALVFIFIILGGRSGPSFIPSRDYSFFVLGCRDLLGPRR